MKSIDELQEEYEVLIDTTTVAWLEQIGVNPGCPTSFAIDASLIVLDGLLGSVFHVAHALCCDTRGEEIQELTRVYRDGVLNVIKQYARERQLEEGE